MAVEGLGSTNSNGIAFLVSAGVVYEIIAAACSSPQTTELNAGKRAPTLMKWVKIGLVQAGFFVGVAAFYDSKHAAPILTGGGLAAGLLMWQYHHAKVCGLASTEPGTESY